MTSITSGLYPGHNAAWPAERPGIRPQDRTEEIEKALAALQTSRPVPDSAGGPADVAAAVAQLQQPRQAETAFRSQQIAQEGGGEAPVEASAEEEEDSAAVKAFLDYMAKSPEERYFEAFLKSKGMTKEDYEALPPEEKQALMTEFKEAVKQRAENESAEKLARTARSELL